MEYTEIEYMPPKKVKAIEERGSNKEIAKMIISISLHSKSENEINKILEKYLKSEDIDIIFSVIQGISHFARRFKKLNLDIFIPKLFELRNSKDQDIRGVVNDTLEDLQIFIGLNFK